MPHTLDVPGEADKRATKDPPLTAETIIAALDGHQRLNEKKLKTVVSELIGRKVLLPELRPLVRTLELDDVIWRRGRSYQLTRRFLQARSAENGGVAAEK